jgi:antitoxin MazE
MHISKWGNSLAVRLPKKLCEEMNLQEGDQIQLVKNTQSNVFEVIRSKSADEILSEIRELRGALTSNAHLTREEANER